MFTAELRINGSLIGVLYGHNEGYVSTENDDCRYTWRYQEIDRGMPVTGELIHAREDGLAELVHKCLTAALEAKKDG